MRRPPLILSTALTAPLGLVHLRRRRRGLTAQTTRPPGCNETHLLPGRRVPPHRTRVTDMLVVTTSVGMLHGVHRHTPHLRPAVPLHLVLVVRVSGLQHRLLRPASARHLPHHRPAPARHHLLRSRRQLDAASTTPSSNPNAISPSHSRPIPRPALTPAQSHHKFRTRNKPTPKPYCTYRVVPLSTLCDTTMA
jgi:hypothetical protein